MILFKKANDLHNWLDKQRKNQQAIGFVPTMGALHQGHISLAETCKKQNDVMIASIFVNPTQFNDPADFEKYPVTIDTDIDKLEKAGCDILFLPSVSEIYPEGHEPKNYQLGNLEMMLEGKFRPGHFQGVCQVVDRLLTMVMPDRLYLGQKDYQQCMVISKLIRLMGLQDKIKVVICPTEREADGLAMSSRNLRLTDAERKRAPAIYATLNNIKTQLGKKPIPELQSEALQFLTEKGFKVDYVEIADAETLEPVNNWDGRQKVVALIAAFNNEVRLIDNMIVSPEVGKSGSPKELSLNS